MINSNKIWVIQTELVKIKTKTVRRATLEAESWKVKMDKQYSVRNMSLGRNCTSRKKAHENAFKSIC